tara:strand:+ start:570 stop:1337 length:768 start_codon:yes stop_codon:yes gene_type:complete
MKIIRFCFNNRVSYGILDNHEVRELHYTIYNGLNETGSIFELDLITVLTPVVPKKIIGLGYNYKDLVGKRVNYDEPVIFLKSPESVIGNGDCILIKEHNKVWSEVELCIVIGKVCDNISINDACSNIFGYTIGNDVTMENIHDRDHHLARSKAWDTFCPLGPHIETDLNTDDLSLENSINGVTFQKGNTRNRIWSDFEIVSHVSKIIKLLPGDIIMTGTPKNAEKSVIRHGDKIVISIEGIGILNNSVKVLNTDS